MNIAVILSAGAGLRFKSSCPKQFLILDDKAILLHSLCKFEEYQKIEKIIVVSNPEYLDETKKLCNGFSKVASVINGGERRQDSVWNALAWIKKNINSCSTVLIHDSARPLFNKTLLDRLFETIKNNDAVIPCIAIDDTIKQKDGNRVVRTLDRASLVRVQTPQAFSFNKIYEAYLSFPKDNIATDDAFIAESTGINVHIVDGDSKNIKITHPSDMIIAELLIKEGC